MNWKQIPAGMYKGALDRLWVEFGNNAGVIATRINTDPQFLRRMVAFALGSVRKTRELSFRFRMPPEVAMVAAVYRIESDPTIEFAIYRKDFDAGKPGDRLVSEGDLAELKVRNFHPGSGCGLLLKDGKLDYVQDGLQNFVGKSVTVLHDPQNPLLVVWENKPMPFPEDFLRDLKSVMSGFSMTLG